MAAGFGGGTALFIPIHPVDDQRQRLPGRRSSPPASCRASSSPSSRSSCGIRRAAPAAASGREQGRARRSRSNSSPRWNAAHAAVLRDVRRVRADGHRRAAGDGQRRADGASRGASAIALTLAATLSPLANGASRIFWGWASDRLGRENTMIVAFVLQAFCLVAGRHASAKSPARGSRSRWCSSTSPGARSTRCSRPRPATTSARSTPPRTTRCCTRRRASRRSSAAGSARCFRAVRQLGDGLLRQRRDGAGRGRLAFGLRAAAGDGEGQRPPKIPVAGVTR